MNPHLQRQHAEPPRRNPVWVFRMAAGFLGLVFLSGCATARFHRLDFEAALARAKAVPAYSDPSNREHSLVSFDVVTLGSLVPDPWSVTEAVGSIEAQASGNPGTLAGAISLGTWESARVYLGDTYERAYASFVGSTAYWMLGEDDNAAALWRNALNIDQESDEGYQTDFAVCNYLLAKYYWTQPGQRDNAEIYLERALAAFPQNPYLDPAHLERDNVLVFIEVGDGPRKTATGPQGSVLEWVPGPSPGGPVTVEVENVATASSAAILDLYLQAVHSLRVTGKEVLQLIKGAAVAAGVGYGVYKLTDDPGWGVLAALVLQLMPADTRQWFGVPAQVQLASFELPPGTYTIRIRGGAYSYSLPLTRETILPAVEVAPYRWTILLVRPVPLLVEHPTAPPPEAHPRGIQPDPDALASPETPILDFQSLDPELKRRSPLYKYLPARDEIQAETASEVEPGGLSR